MPSSLSVTTESLPKSQVGMTIEVPAEARLGPAALREEVVETIVPEVIRAALAEKSISPIDNPDVEVLELERGRPARLKATVTVMPQVTLGDATALDIATPSVDVTDEMIERRIDDVREPMAEITPVDREARAGDIVVIDVEVEAGGVVVPSESRQAMEAELKEGVLLPELIEAIKNAKVGDTRSATVKHPDGYGEAMLAGKDGTIK